MSIETDNIDEKSYLATGKVSFQDAIDLIIAYTKKKISEQVRSVAFIVVYLLAFQLFILKLPIQDSVTITLGLLSVVLGLTLFIEGLFLGLMPIGESLGLKIPQRLGLGSIIVFAFILGLGSTYAEPAIGVLRTMGAKIEGGQAPLLFYLLNVIPNQLVIAVGAGVGIAVILSMLRFLYNWSLKPSIYVLVIILLVISGMCFSHPDIARLLGLAWDCGAVTTGPVTVPLVLALGLGVSRVVTGHTNEGTSSGFGIVTLASLLPIIAVLLLGFLTLQTQGYQDFTSNLSMNLHDYDSLETQITDETSHNWYDFLLSHLLVAVQAIVPLCLFMIIIYRFVLKEKFLFFDEIVFGLVLALVGLMLFNIGNQFGLGKLGGQVGQYLPATYGPIKLHDELVVLKPFNPQHVYYRYDIHSRSLNPYIIVQNKKATQFIPYDEQGFNALDQSYEYVPTYGPLWGESHGENDFSALGLFGVIVFAFFLGYGATLAEPALSALGTTVENITVGAFRKNTLIQTVAIGVGVGIAIGICKIVWDISIFYLLAPLYTLLLLLSYFSSEEFVNIAWDSAGVTTGPITVPLVMAMGLGIGEQTQAVEGFGVLAMASVFPIMSVLCIGLVIRYQRANILRSKSQS